MYHFDDPQLSEKIEPRGVETALGPVEYVEFGQGPAVVCIHGAMGGYDQSLILAQTVGVAGYRYIAVSRPGYLGTPLYSGKSPREQADLIAALLNELELDAAGVLAISGGGPAAVEFAIQYPQRCRGVVLISTCADKTPQPVPLSFKIMMRLVRWDWFVSRIRHKAAGDLAAVARQSIHEPAVFERIINDERTWPLFCRLLMSTFERMADRTAGTKNDIRITRTASYDLEKLSSPTLIVHGTDDQLMNFTRQTGIYMSRLPNARLLAVEGGEHVAIFTHRDIVQKQVRAFMNEHFDRS